MANNNYTTHEDKEEPDKGPTFDVQDVQEVHTTHDDEEEPDEGPTIHDEQIIEEMNVTNM